MLSTPNVIVCAVPLTPPTASNVPSDAGGSGGFAAAERVTTPPALMFAPPVIAAAAVGVIVALAVNVATLSSPPVALNVLASESYELIERAVMAPSTRMTDAEPPSVTPTVGSPSAVEDELPIWMSPPPRLRIPASARSFAWARTVTVFAPLVLVLVSSSNRRT